MDQDLSQDPYTYLANSLFAQRPVGIDKAIEKLLGEGIKSDYINDDKLGRVRDELYKYGLNDIFIEVVLSVIKKFRIETKYSHLDATSFHLEGKYERENQKNTEEEILKERPIIISKGYSRDHRPDLKQCVLDLITTSDGDLPLFVRVGDGNEADKAVFGKILAEFKKQINLDSIMVCDSALYSQENLQIIEHLSWISRVPMTIKRAKELVGNVEIEEIDEEERKKRVELNLAGYRWKEEKVTQVRIEQIWWIVASEKRQKSDLEKLEKNLKKEKNKLEKLLKELQKEEFENPEQARYKLKGINKKLNSFEISETEIVTNQSKEKKTIYKIRVIGQEKTEEIARRRKEAGRFILATNLVDKDKLDPAEILTTYKKHF